MYAQMAGIPSRSTFRRTRIRDRCLGKPSSQTILWSWTAIARSPLMGTSSTIRHARSIRTSALTGPWSFLYEPTHDAFLGSHDYGRVSLTIRNEWAKY
jgi:hypothetical protein